MEIIKQNYNFQCESSSDINEHLPTFHEYALECDHITEMGMRAVVSTWAFAYGLACNNYKNKHLITVDLEYASNLEPLKRACKEININFVFIMGDDVKINIDQTDLLFIDTFHVKAHLQEELRLHAHKVNKYILIHDTEVDDIHGECVRRGWDANEIAKETGYSVKDINSGLGPAIFEFLENYPEWTLREKYTNNNGLTVLERVVHL